ncbi:MAG: hypothetical protein ABSA26_06845 [Thermoguttaceae bacterium]
MSGFSLDQFGPQPDKGERAKRGASPSAPADEFNSPTGNQLQAVGTVEPICPYCSAVLKKKPIAKTKCWSCGNFMYVRTRPLDNQSISVREDQLELVQEQWAIHYGTHARFLAERRRRDEETKLLSQKLGREPTHDEVDWSRLEKDLADHAARANWSSYRRARSNMGDILRKGQKWQEALMTYLEVAYLDLNEPRDHDALLSYPVPQEEQEERAYLESLGSKRPVSAWAKEVQRWWPNLPPETEALIRNLPPDLQESMRRASLMFAGDPGKLTDFIPTVPSVHNLACKLGYELREVKERFYPIAERQHNLLKLPVSPSEAWQKIAEVLSSEAERLAWNSPAWRQKICERSLPDGGKCGTGADSKVSLTPQAQSPCQPGIMSKEVKVSWVPTMKNLTKHEQSVELLCQKCGIPLEIDPKTRKRTATFTIKDASYAKRFLGLQWIAPNGNAVEDASDARRFLEFLSFALRWKSTSVTLPTGELRLRDLHGLTFCRVVDCWVSHTGSPDYCSTVPPGNYPSHQISHCPCKLVHRYAGFSPEVPAVENRAASPTSDVSNLEPECEDDEEAFATWCWECSQETAPGRWRLDKNAVRRIVTKTLAENPIDVCPQFDAQRIVSWLDNLPDEVVFTEDGWLAIEVETGRLEQEIKIIDGLPVVSEEIDARLEELRLHPLRRWVKQGSGLPW